MSRSGTWSKFIEIVRCQSSCVDIEFPMIFSSGDSLNKDIAYQKKQYDDAINRKAKNVLSLQHDVKSVFLHIQLHQSSLTNFFFFVIADSIHTVLPYAIQKLQGAGYKLVTLAECLGEQPYSKTGPPQQRTVS